jgi:methionyl-tRNA synthetase
MGRIFIGVAWPYANAPVHIGGFAGVYLPADIFARFHRLRGDDVLMVSGSDQHGTPILVTAEKEGATPADVAARYHQINSEALQALGVSFDLFTSTRTTVHERTVQETFLLLLENGFISRKTEENAYCPTHRRFLPDRYVVGECPHCHSPTARGDECDRCGRILEPKQLIGPKCRLCGNPAEFRPSEHFYLLLDKLQPRLAQWLAEPKPWRANVVGTTRNFIEGGLHPTPITRDLDWGVPIPLEGYPTKRFYVWFDAVIGYLSASREWAIRAGRPDAWRPFWESNADARAYYFLGKDNIFFHTIVWPSILLGRGGLRLPYDVPANEWLQIDGRKISKSRPADADAFLPSLVKRYPADAIRGYAALLAPQNHDTEFDWDEFHQVIDDVFSNQYGNLVQRVLVLARERCDGRVPAPPAGWSADAAGGLGAHLREVHAAVTADLGAVRLKEAFDRILTEVREENRRFHDAQPWQAPAPERDRALYEAIWLLRAAAVWLAPYLPTSSAEVYRMLGFPAPPAAGDWDAGLVPVPAGQRLGEIRPLFPRREENAPAAPPTAPPASPPAASVEPAPLDLRVAVIESAENHPSADRLYVLRLDAGDAAPRTVVAGMRPFYTVDELRGRRVVLLANLEPRTIRKVTSQGMVLAADTGERAVLLLPPGSSAPGTRLVGAANAPPTVRYEDFERSPLLIGRVVGPGAEGGSRVDVGGREVDVPGTWIPGEEVVVRLPVAGASVASVLSFAPAQPVGTGRGLPAGTKVR